MKLQVIDKTGKKTTKTFSLEKEIFENESHSSILRQAIHVHRTNSRTGTAVARGRGDVAGTGRKPWANNKMGMARAGDKLSPIFKGGGVSHGPVKMNYALKFPKALKRTALYLALSDAVKENKIFIIEDLFIEEEQMTKNAFKILNDIKEANKLKSKSVSIYYLEDNNITLGFRNLKGVRSYSINHINPYDLVNSDLIIIFESAFEKLNGANVVEEKTTEPKVVKASKKESKVEVKGVKSAKPKINKEK